MDGGTWRVTAGIGVRSHDWCSRRGVREVPTQNSRLNTLTFAKEDCKKMSFKQPSATVTGTVTLLTP